MLMNDKIIVDPAKTNEIMVHYILLPHHIFICVKAFIPGSLQFLNSMCYAWHPVMSISKSHVLTAGAHMNCNINTWLSLH